MLGGGVPVLPSPSPAQPRPRPPSRGSPDRTALALGHWIRDEPPAPLFFAEPRSQMGRQERGAPGLTPRAARFCRPEAGPSRTGALTGCPRQVLPSPAEVAKSAAAQFA